MIAFTWRVGDPAQPGFDRYLLYTARLRGTQPTVVQPVPVGRMVWWALSLLVVLAGTLSLRIQGLRD